LDVLGRLGLGEGDLERAAAFRAAAVADAEFRLHARLIDLRLAVAGAAGMRRVIVRIALLRHGAADLRLFPRHRLPSSLMRRPPRPIGSSPCPPAPAAGLSLR